MLIADGGGGYGGTDWNSKDVRYMWQAIADQETDKHFDVVAGWRQTADLTITHLGQVQMYRDNLASVWPPSKSPAAAAYLERLDKLIADLQATHDAASANYTAFSTVALTLSLARNKLKPLYDQYEANRNANLAWQAEQDAKPVDPTEPPKISLPPVSSTQQEQLNNQARVIMFDLSSTLISGQSALQKPKPYDPAAGGNKSDESKRAGRDDSSGFAPPPVIPLPGGDTGGSGHRYPSGQTATANTSAGHVSHAAPVHPAPVVPGAGGPLGGGTIGSGPILGSAGPSVMTPSSPQVVAPPSPPNPAGPSGLIPGVVPPPGGTGMPPTTGFPPGKPAGAGAVKPGFGAGSAGKFVAPPGGVIGGSPGNALIGQPSSSSLRGSPASKVNPVGGVIGQQGNSPMRGSTPGGRQPSAHSSRASTIPGQPGRARRSHDGKAEHTQWDPDNPWMTDEGVDPVLMPPADPGPIDPGPVIGYTR
ncbi:hypothetical protein ACPCHT_16705 [Nucisporomicrobium flavum]|uniref:hypothetical protein n=1 Tax=Nucisporomicrobium flavum TaxID=2785915 RepID=UPI003C2F42A6